MQETAYSVLVRSCFRFHFGGLEKRNLIYGQIKSKIVLNNHHVVL